ncbi:MAG: endonuclease/exonuclease/phosphatase family protein [Fimbriimonadaceae bacterium]|nr:endonuclease/exonuclease/phosphatase family protein [Fimbriimonadaceae bacterium]
MGKLKIVSWNVAHMERLIQPNLSTNSSRRRDAVVEEVRRLDPDIWCLLEGPKGESAIDEVANGLLAGDYVPVKLPPGSATEAQRYAQQGQQWVWWLVRPHLAQSASLLAPEVWDDFTEKSFEVYRWGETTPSTHSHYRHPQTLVLDVSGNRIELIGLHLKSKFINMGKSLWQSDPPAFMRKAVEARMKMAREATNVRDYVDARFDQTPNPAIFVMGDFNDGPGKEWFEDRFLFFDLISNIQGDVFFSGRYLFHALFDFPQDLRWTAKFADFVVNETEPKPILLDHILFTQSLTNGSCPWRIGPGAGKVEHEVHALSNASLPQAARTSDHSPVSVIVDTPD